MYKLLKKKAPGCIILHENIVDFNGQLIAVDAPNQIRKYTMPIINNGDSTWAHIRAAHFKSISYLNNGNLPIYIFDGPSPSIKKDVLRDRRKNRIKAMHKLNNDKDNKLTDEEKIRLQKRCYSFKKKHIDDIKEYFDYIGLPYIQATGEADIVCAELNKLNIVRGVASEDWDILPFGAPNMLRDFSNKKIIQEIVLEKALEEMELTQDQFIDICILLGTDYCSAIRGITPIRIYEEYKKCGSMESFMHHINTVNDNNLARKIIIPKDFINKWVEIKKYYQNTSINTNIMNRNFVWAEPDPAKLFNFLHSHGFSKKNANKQINNIMILYKNYKIHGKVVSKFCNRCNNKYVKYYKFKNKSRRSYESPWNKNKMRNNNWYNNNTSNNVYKKKGQRTQETYFDKKTVSKHKYCPNKHSKTNCWKKQIFNSANCS